MSTNRAAASKGLVATLSDLPQRYRRVSGLLSVVASLALLLGMSTTAAFAEGASGPPGGEGDGPADGAAYTLVKSSDQNGKTVMPGTVINYTLTLTNGPDAVLHGFAVTDELSAVLDHATMKAMDEALDQSGTTLTWRSNADVPAGGWMTVTYSVTVNPDAWGVTLTNAAAPDDGEPGTCAADQCSTTTYTPPVTRIVVHKSDPETGAALDGAVFELYAAAEPLGEPLATVTTVGGLAVFNDVVVGDYFVVETIPPEGYFLPNDPKQPLSVTMGDMGSEGDVNIWFEDPPKGHMGVITKTQAEFVGEGWSPLGNDAEVGYGQSLKYTITLPLIGPREFRGLTVSDYVPGYGPDAAKSTAKATYVDGSATCGGLPDCVASYDPATGLVKWVFTSDVAVGLTTKIYAVSFEVVFPSLPASPTYVDGFHTDVAWNQARADWKWWSCPDEVPTLARRPVQGAAAMVENSCDNSEVSNAVKATAKVPEPVVPPVITQPKPPVITPPKVKVPGKLPNTGGPDARWLYGGGGLVVLGVVVLLSRRRRPD